MIPSEGELQALYEIPLPPDVVQRPAAGDRGTAQQPSAGETAYQNYLSARATYLGALNEWAVDFRPVTGLAKDQYSNEQLGDLARSARAMLAAELGSLSPADGNGVATTWTAPDGTTYSVRRLPMGVMQTATAYLVRAMFYDGISKGDVYFWSKADRYAEFVDWTKSDSAGYVESSPDNLHTGRIRREREMGPRGTNRLIDRSGALRMIAPYVSRRLVQVS